jgi:peptidoglycan/LPS O-acetylase OafA/YrhL
MIMDDSLRAVRRALIIFLAAVLVSVLAALTMIGFAALTTSLAWSVIGGLLVAALVSWILGSRILRRDRKAQRLVIGPLVVLGCAAVISLTWLYPGTGGVRPDPVAGVEWLDLPIPAGAPCHPGGSSEVAGDREMDHSRIGGRWVSARISAGPASHDSGRRPCRLP